MNKETERKVVVYQVMTRLFGNQNTTNKLFGTIEENGVGKFSDFNETALKGIKELGVTHIWYTGVIEDATLTDYSAFGIPLDDADVVKGRAGSPYAIKDYYDINPDLATDVKNRVKEFEQLVDRTHAQEMKVLIDIVPNHVARAYKSDAKPAGTKDLGEGDDTSLSFKPSNNFYYVPGQDFQPPANYNSLGNQNTCQYIKIAKQIRFMQLAQSGEIDKITQELEKDVELYKTQYGKPNQELTALLKYRDTSLKANQAVEKQVTKDEGDIQAIDEQLKINSDNLLVCIMSQELINWSKDGKTFPASVFVNLEKAA